MEKLLDKLIEWALRKKRWPLLFLIGFLPLFAFARNFFELSYRETFWHWCFLISGGILLILSGVLYIAIASPKLLRLRLGGPLLLSGALFFIAGLLQFTPPTLPDDKLVVAIAKFTPISSGAIDEAENFTHRIEQRLREKQLEGAPLKIRRLTVQVVGPDEEARRKAAIALGKSRKGSAHVIIWGEIRKDEGELYVLPYLTIARQIQRANIGEKKLLETVSNEPTHLEFKKRLSTEIADVVMLVYGLAYYRTGNWNKAIQILSHVDSNEGYLMLGIACLAKGDYQMSVTPFKKAISINPENALAYNNLGIAYLYLWQFDNSKRYLEKSLSIAPDNPDILSNLGLLQLSKGDYEGASDNFKKALVYNDNPKTRSNLAFCLFELGKTKEAIDEWEKSLATLREWKKSSAIRWDGLDAKAGLAVGYYSVGNIEEAKTLYSQVVELKRDYRDLQLLETKFFWPERAKSKAAELIKACQ